MDKIKLVASLIALIISTFTFAQNKFTAQLVMQTGNSFIAGQWKNIDASDYPPFKRKVTPSLEAGLNTVYHFKGKAGKKVVYDEMFASGFYLADKIAFNLGLFYSFGGQSYKDMKDMAQPGITWSKKLRLQYLKIPLRFEFIKGKENDNQLIYTAGFYAAYLTWYKEKKIETRDNNQLSIITKNSVIDSTTTDLSHPGDAGTSIQYKLDSKPYQVLDYGMSLGVGMQKKLNSDWTMQFILIGQIGFTDIKNISAKYRHGSTLIPYFETTETAVNGIISHKNSSLGLTIGLKKTFEWTAPSSATKQTRKRIFRFKK